MKIYGASIYLTTSTSHISKQKMPAAKSYANYGLELSINLRTGVSTRSTTKLPAKLPMESPMRLTKKPSKRSRCKRTSRYAAKLPAMVVPRVRASPKGKGVPESQKCSHNVRKYFCVPCKGGGICPHDMRKSLCMTCSPQNFCGHLKTKRFCRDCASVPLMRINKKRLGKYTPNYIINEEDGFSSLLGE